MNCVHTVYEWIHEPHEQKCPWTRNSGSWTNPWTIWTFIEQFIEFISDIWTLWTKKKFMNSKYARSWTFHMNVMNFMNSFMCFMNKSSLTLWTVQTVHIVHEQTYELHFWKYGVHRVHELFTETATCYSS